MGVAAATSVRRTLTVLVSAWALVALVLLGAPPSVAAGPGPATTLSVRAPASATAGVAFTVTVTARDSAGHIATGYRGKVTLTSDDPRNPTLHSGYAFTATDKGVHTFVATLRTAGAHTLTATGTGTTLTGTARTTVTAAAATRFAVTGPTTTDPGQPFTVQVVAKDPWFNYARTYRGTITFTSTDPAATLPAPYTFTATDNGVHTFPGLVLRSPGPRTLTATDTTITGTLTVTVTSTAGVYTWGDGQTGVLGDGTTADRSLPVRVLSGEWADVETSTWSDFAIRADRTLWGWGNDGWGQVGTGPGYGTLLPRQVGTQADWGVVAAGYQHTMAIRTNGSLWGWGDNEYYALGTGPYPGPEPQTQDAPVKVGTDRNWASIAAGLFHSAGVRTDGTLWGWGANDPGPFGDPSGGTRTIPFQVGTDTDWAVVSSGGDSHTVALKKDGTMWMLMDAAVQLGAGYTWVAIDVGWSFDVAIRSDGTLWTFGPFTPLTQVGTDAGWVRASAGGGHGLALRADGSLWAWGANDDGQLGDGTTTARPTPVQVGLGRQWVDAAAGFQHSIAIAK
ncbi:hypothetical protein HP550_18800 [Cellulomonas humilata]|uniref:RCC1-like domain-containing protein n=1 Tax=Cellulomonas humilata TaxID=144055 RepID=A0A7Y6A3Y7_9CELL|nr:hypothetical protein [Cellulomonas humilata]NUU19302.1 hypothetical protein [Cellulomonas humilata]